MEMLLFLTVQLSTISSMTGEIGLPSLEKIACVFVIRQVFLNLSSAFNSERLPTLKFGLNFGSEFQRITASGLLGGPNKFFALWSDGYSANGDGSTFWLAMSRSSESTTNLNFSYSPGSFQASGGFQQSQPFINPKDRGRWMEFVMHIKAETSDGASDGIVETFIRWKNESRYNKLHELFTAAIKLPANGVPDGFQKGLHTWLG